MKTVTIFGSKYIVNTPVFVILCILWLTTFILSAMGVYKFGQDIFNAPWLLMLSIFALTVDVTINDTEYRIIPNGKFKRIMNGILFYGFIAYWFIG